MNQLCTYAQESQIVKRFMFSVSSMEMMFEIRRKAFIAIPERKFNILFVYHYIQRNEREK